MLMADSFQMRRLDDKLSEKYSMIELVQKAADCLAEEIQQPALIFCGKGNNGADGYALACRLHDELIPVWVVPCELFNQSEANLYYYQQCEKEGLILDFETLKQKRFDFEVIVDAVFGFGCHHQPNGIYQEIIHWINQCPKKTIAVDVASGLDCDSGYPFDNCVQADQTITFFALKQGFHNPASHAFLGEVIVKRLDVDLDERLYLSEMVDTISLRKRAYESHKGTFGKAVLICGSKHYQGAALLSSKACVAAGCGITTLCSVDEVLNIMPIYCPEVTLLHHSELSTSKAYQAALVGCGIDEDEKLLQQALDLGIPLVIDATALKLIAAHPDLLNQKQASVILTPHLKEFERLCPAGKHLISDAEQYARLHDCILVVKGPLTIITDGKKTYRNTTGNPTMATGGSGDVLAGIITSLLAQGYDPLESAKIGVFLHGKCADRLALDCYTSLPSKIIEELPFVMKEMVK